MSQYTAIIKQRPNWWVGRIEEMSGVNSQGKSREELLSNLRSALSEAIDMNREAARIEAGSDFEEMPLRI